MNPTQKMIKRLFLSIAISVAALIAGTSSAAADVTRCDGQLASGTYDTVLVPKGKTCRVVGGLGVTVEQNLILQEGASLFTTVGFTVNGNLQGDGVKIVNLQNIPMITIHGNVSITGATEEVALGDMIIGGNLNISDSNGLVFFFDSQVTGNALFQNNTTTPPHGFGIAGNTIVGNLVCNGNNRAPELVSNTVSGQSIGQCALP